jgi:hypothetical protein
VGAIALGVEAAEEVTVDSNSELTNGRTVASAVLGASRSINSEDTDRSEDRGRV